MVKESARFTLNKTDMKEWVKNTLIFAAPVLIVAIPSLINQIPADYKYAAVILYALNIALDILRKFVNGKVK